MTNPEKRELFGYRAQFDRMVRQLVIADKPGADLATKEDELINVFLHAWSLKDHAKKDPSLPAGAGKRLEDAAHASTILQTAQQVANGSKHLTCYPAKMSGTNDTTVFATSHNETYPHIGFDNGPPRRAIDVAHEVVDEWRRIFASEGVAL